jgi:integrase
MAFITKREGKNTISFQVRYRVNGKVKVKSFRAKNETATSQRNAKKEAERFLKKIESQSILGLVKDESNMTFKEYGDVVFEIIESDLKTTTKKAKEVYRKVVNKNIGNIKLKDITPLFLDKYFFNLSKKKSHHVVDRHRGIINTVLESAFKKDLIVVNPMLKLDFKFKKGRLKEKKVIELDDFKEFIYHVATIPGMIKYKFYLLFAFFTGMRRGEILALTWDDIDFEYYSIHVNKSLNRYGEITTPKTKSSIRYIVIHNMLLELLYEIKTYQDDMKRKHKEKYINNNLVICHDNGEYLQANAVDHFLYRHSRILNIEPITSHRIRHTFATLMRGMEVKDVQALLGHSKVEMTVNTYQHHDKYKDETVQEINARLPKIF